MLNASALGPGRIIRRSGNNKLLAWVWSYGSFFNKSGRDADGGVALGIQLSAEEICRDGKG